MGFQDSTAKVRTNALFTGGSVSILGKSVVEVGKGKSFITAAGDKIGLKYVEKAGSIINDSTLSDAKKVEKIVEVISQDKEASALMAAVRGQVDNATTAAPQTSTAIPAATSVESTNVAAGEGVMSSDESAVKGVDEKKK